MEFGAAIKSGFKKTFVYEGRASRSEFWWFYLFTLLTMIAIFTVGGIVGAALGAGKENGAGWPGGLIIGLGILYLIAMIFPTLSLIVRRLHDSDKSGLFVLLSFIPFGGLVLLVFYCLPGTSGPNKFGDDPLRPMSVASVF